MASRTVRRDWSEQIYFVSLSVLYMGAYDDLETAHAHNVHLVQLYAFGCVFVINLIKCAHARHRDTQPHGVRV